MAGFFDDAELRPVTIGHNRKLSCLQCKLYNGCLSPRMQPSGGGKKQIYVLAEAPGKTEDEKGTQLVGETGKFLQSELNKFDISLHDDCIKDNSVRCRPPKNRTPDDVEIDSCRPNVLDSIKLCKPKLILLFGEPSLRSFVGGRWKKTLGGIGKWRGFVFPDREYNAWVAPLNHPSYVMRSEKKPVIKKIFKDDLKNALSYLDRPLPNNTDETDYVKILTGTDIDNVLNTMLETAKTNSFLMAFDYETTGIKPYANGHKIACASICYSDTMSYAFKFPLQDSTLKLFTQVLEHPNIQKTAHNMKFEDIWSSVILKTKVQGWRWCSMQGTHVLDNRSGITSLKFQAAVNFGLYNYDEDIKPFLESNDKKNANSFNKVFDISERKLLTYCAIDSLVQYRLALKQMSILNETLE